MAKVYTRGGSASQKKYLHSITEFALPLMMSKRLANTLQITYRMVPNLFNKNDVLGDAWTDDDERYPKEFVIRLDPSLKMRNFLETACHELVHVKQWATGQMRDYDRNHDITRYGNKKVNTDQIDYWDLPWEIEAHGREVGLFVRWVKHENLQKRKWTKYKY